MTKLKKRICSVILAVVLSLNLIDTNLLKRSIWEFLAHAAAQDYTVSFKWDTSELTADGKADDGSGTVENPKRVVELSDGGTTLKLTENKEESPVLKTTFFFNMKRAIAPRNLTFTITGLDQLIRDGGLQMSMNDPNLVRTWEIQKVEGQDAYTFTNLTSISSNNETTFTWQFDSRDAVNFSDIVLNTTCTVTEVETIEDEGGNVTVNTTNVPLQTNSLRLQYESTHDDNEVKIVCETLHEMDTNNLNTAYNWRSYKSVLGLDGLEEYELDPALYPSNLADAHPTDSDEDAHFIRQNQGEQQSNRNARGIKKADYFIEVNIGDLDPDDVMVVDRNGSRVQLASYRITTQEGTKTVYGFYDFKGKNDFNPKAGESYSSIYRVGVLKEHIADEGNEVTLTGHLLATYYDEAVPTEYTDSAKHKVAKEDEQNVGDGDYVEKHNRYEEQNYYHYYGDVKVLEHAKHPDAKYQLLKESVFSGRVVTYHLHSHTKQWKGDSNNDPASPYDLVLEDGAPSVQNLTGSPAERELSADEYDFVRVKVEKFVDGETVNNDPNTPERGFDFVLYGKTAGGDWSIMGDPDGNGISGNTNEATEIFLPANIDEIKIVVKDLNIRSEFDVSVDVRYRLHEEDAERFFIDEEHEYEMDGNRKVCGENTNQGTRLVNTFNRIQYAGSYDIGSPDAAKIKNQKQAHSNTWLRGSTAILGASTSITEFTVQGAETADPQSGYQPDGYYTAEITAKGSVKADTEKGLHHFVVASKLPTDTDPCENWLEAVKQSFRFSGIVQGTCEEIDETDLFAENAVTFYYDWETNSVCADINLDSFALKLDDPVECEFTYPIEISYERVKEKGGVQRYTTDVYVTVLDKDIKLMAPENRTLTSGAPVGLEVQALKASDYSKISALGSQKMNETTKQIKSYYTKWSYASSATVDGSNTDFLDPQTGRMTSEYSYRMVFNRVVQGEAETDHSPILLDIVEGAKTGQWRGTVKSVSFEPDSYPEGLTPVVYYMPISSSSVEANNETIPNVRYDYQFTNTEIKEAIENFQKYNTENDTSYILETVGLDQVAIDLQYYHHLYRDITQDETDGWRMATLDPDTGEWIIEQDNVYAVAVIYEGNYTIPGNSLTLTAVLNMRAAQIANQSDAVNNKAENNTACYNDCHAFAISKNPSNVEIPLYSVSRRTLTLLNHYVELEKVSVKNGKRLTGAEFSVYENAAGTEYVQYHEYDTRHARTGELKQMENMPVDATGILRLNLAPGIYYYRETKPPQGYIGDTNIYRFRSVADANAVYCYTVDLKPAGTDMDRQYLIVNKNEYEDPGNADVYSGQTVISPSVVFHLYDGTGTAVDQLVLNSEGAYEYSMTNPIGNTNVSCDSDGIITLKNLPAGTYYLATSPVPASAAEQEADPERYDRYTFSIADKSSISLAALKKNIVTSGVQYQLYKKVNGQILSNQDPCRFTGSNGSYALTTGSGGTDVLIPNSTTGGLTVSGLDPNEEYYLLCTEAPAGFRRSTQPVMEFGGQTGFDTVAVEQLMKTNRLVVENTPIDSATASFKKIDATAEDRPSVNDAKYRMYLVEGDGTETLLYFQSKIVDGQQRYVYAGTTGSADLTADLTSQTLGETDGLFTVSGIGYGIYCVQESVPPAGYQLDTTKHFFRVSVTTLDQDGTLLFGSTEGDEQTVGNTMRIMSLEDHEILSTIELNKTEELDTSKRLGYATYKMFRLKDGMNLEEAKEAAANSRGNTESDEFTAYWELKRSNIETDIAGQATITRVPFGTYLLYEDQPPAGYKWNNDLAQWETWTEMSAEHTKNSQIIVLSPETLAANSTSTIKEDGSEEITYYSFYAHHKDERKTGEARLLKSSIDSKPLTDGNFTLCQVAFTDNEWIRALAKRYAGTATTAEFNALDDDVRNGYLSQAAAVYADAESKRRVQSTMVLTEDDVITAEHFDDGKPIQGVDNVVRQNLKTSEIPDIGATETVSGLEWGVYYFYEVKAPAGYQKDVTPQFFTVNSGNVSSLIEVNMTDDKTYGKIWMYKQAMEETAGGHFKLFGAQFVLNTRDNEPVYSVPRLRLGGLNVSGGQKEFLVTGFTVVEKNKLTFTLEQGYTVTITYDESDAGQIMTIEPDTGFISVYGSDCVLSASMADDDPMRAKLREAARLTYYAVTADHALIYDDAMKKYREISSEEAACITNTYVTADTGGQLCVRGLDWGSYYFRETVPPEGYGVAEDVLFTVNKYNCDNQYLPCEDPKATASVIIDKEVPDASYYSAYGNPTFLFKVYGLEPAGTGDTVAYTANDTDYRKNGTEYTLAIHLSDLDTFGSAMVDVPVGCYLIEELPVSRYECVALEMVSGTNGAGDKFRNVGLTTPTSYAIYNDPAKYDINNGTASKPWTAFCDLNGGDSAFGEVLAFHVKYSNDISRYDHFSQVSFADNQIPGQEYITAFKPVYIPLVPAGTYTESNVGGTTCHEYVIDLATALGTGDFEATLSYNTERIEPVTSLEHIRFSPSAADPIKNVTFDPNDGQLHIFIDADAAPDGQSFKLDAGYCEAADFTEYNEDRPDMIKGEMMLTFSETLADTRKRIILRNDTANKSYFEYADGGTGKDVTSVAVIYKKNAETGAISSEMENSAYTDRIRLNNAAGMKISGYYLLNSDGKPVMDTENKIVLFKDTNEIQAFIFDGTYPSKYQIHSEQISTVMSEMQDKVDTTNSYTFQAYVEKIIPTARLAPGGDNAINTFLKNLGVTKTGVVRILKGDEAGYNSAANNNKKQWPGVYSDEYPDDIRFYSNGSDTIYWYTVDPDTGDATNGEVYVSGATGGGAAGENTKGWFNGWSNLADISGLSDWDLSGIAESTNKMFAGTALTDVVFNVPVMLSSQSATSFNRLFYGCTQLRSVSMTISMVNAKYSQMKEMFVNCSSLTTLNLVVDASDGYSPYSVATGNQVTYDNHDGVGQMLENFKGCSSLTTDELIRAISTWKLPPKTIIRFLNGYNKVNNISTSKDIVDATGKIFRKGSNNNLVYISG